MTTPRPVLQTRRLRRAPIPDMISNELKRPVSLLSAPTNKRRDGPRERSSPPCPRRRRRRRPIETKSERRWKVHNSYIRYRSLMLVERSEKRLKRQRKEKLRQCTNVIYSTVMFIFRFLQVRGKDHCSLCRTRTRAEKSEPSQYPCTNGHCRCLCPCRCRFFLYLEVSNLEANATTIKQMCV